MTSKEKLLARGRIFELIQEEQPDGRIFEIARRAPGVRLIIADKKEGKVLLTKEFRRELQEYDFRLPGGKVFDLLEEFESFRASGENIQNAAEKQAKVEAAEEAGIEITDLQLIQKSTLGTTVEWDLYVFEAREWQLHKDGQQLKENEVDHIAGVDFYDYDTVKRMIMNGDISEERVALILLRWIEMQKKEKL
jgi:ADP-ribose pyrophosphatase